MTAARSSSDRIKDILLDRVCLQSSVLESLLSMPIAIATEVTELELSENVDVGQWKTRCYKVEEDRRSDLLSTNLSYRNTSDI
jgi:hypothetical protein